jgi:signal transduction histidine kinase/pSer/pThr/pTyr-binding forkhead associated (FHA) protein
VPSLFVIRGNDQGARYELQDKVVSVGRDSSNFIQLHDTEVSRRHAEFRRVGETTVVADLGSSNGTYLNGHRIQQQELRSGDQLQLGGTLMLFTAASTDSAATNMIDIVGRHQLGDSSRIVRSMAQEEGSKIFEFEAGESPWLARARSNLQIMYRTALAVSHTLEIDDLLDRIMQLIFEWVECDRGCIMLLDPETSKLVPKVRRDRNAGDAVDRLSISQTILDFVFEHNEGVLTSNAREDDRWDPAASIVQLGIREAICVPMRGRYDVVGVIYIDTSTPPEQVIRASGNRINRFNDEHLKLMIAIAHQAALAVEDTRYYRAMVQAERLAAIGQTIAMLSHHIKNILQGIRGGSYLIETGLSEHDEKLIRKGWDIVERNQGKISTLVLDMLTFSKEREPELGPANLNDVTHDVVELMQVRADEREVELIYRPAPSMPTLTFDSEGLHRAILNVVTNAIDACDREDPEVKPGRVEVETAWLPVEGLARVTVRDNGSGIAAEDLDQIFTLFVSKKGGRGTGLGLPVSNKILNEHGGRIRVESQPGEGSCFYLEFPTAVVESDPDDSSVRSTTISQ